MYINEKTHYENRTGHPALMRIHLKTQKLEFLDLAKNYSS